MPGCVRPAPAHTPCVCLQMARLSAVAAARDARHAHVLDAGGARAPGGHLGRRKDGAWTPRWSAGIALRSGAAVPGEQQWLHLKIWSSLLVALLCFRNRRVCFGVVLLGWRPYHTMMR